MEAYLAEEEKMHYHFSKTENFKLYTQAHYLGNVGVIGIDVYESIAGVLLDNILLTDSVEKAMKIF